MKPRRPSNLMAPPREVLRAEIQRLADIGISAAPVIGKKPATLAWREYQRRRPCEKELDDMLDVPGVSGIAAFCGAVSSNLVVRDFDEPTSYERFRADNPFMAAHLPTSKTSRGFQLWFRTTGVSRISHFADGELRGRGISVAPPSLHPSGVIYQWLNRPSRELPTLGVDEVQLLVAGVTAAPGKRSGERRSIARPAEGDFVPAATVAEAIVATLPQRYGERNRKLLLFARYMLGLLGRNSPEAQVKDAVRQWHEAALPTIRTKSWAVTWNEFRAAWETTFLVPCNFQAAVEQMQALAVSDDPKARLDALCQALQSQFGQMPMFLACRQAGSAIGVDHKRAHRIMRELEEAKILERVRTGTLAGRKGTTWFYRAQSGTNTCN